mgnify:CR=1 FL=1|jgi:NTP pyrophosphatase (non-canonical NTP hydrolase)
MEHNLLKQVFDTLQDKSMIIAMEELAELQQAISKGIRGKLDKDNLTEEIADVYIVLDWIKSYFSVDDEELAKWYKYKENRIVDRLNRGELR